MSDEDQAASVGEFRKNLILTEEVFPESVLADWGYKTTGFEEGVHAIRSKRNYGTSEVAFYARFSLARARFSDEAEAEREKERIEALLETDAGFKDYTQLLRRGNLLYSFSPSGNRVYLGHQPQLLKDAAIHLNLRNAEPGGAGQPAGAPGSKPEGNEK